MLWKVGRVRPLPAERAFTLRSDWIIKPDVRFGFSNTSTLLIIIAVVISFSSLAVNVINGIRGGPTASPVGVTVH
jgi:hypothetical protein